MRLEDIAEAARVASELEKTRTMRDDIAAASLDDSRAALEVTSELAAHMRLELSLSEAESFLDHRLVGLQKRLTDLGVKIS